MKGAFSHPGAADLAVVRHDIDMAAADFGRQASEITLIAVSKAFSVDAIRRAMDAGQVDFGENRAKELTDKAAALTDPAPRWHFIGRLQRNKVARVLRANPTIHSLDRIELARKIEATADRPVRVLIEVNASGEPSKGGVLPSEAPALVEETLGMSKLDLVGLMTMAPRTADPELSRPVFRELARLRTELADRYSCPRIHHLSMGMSQDYRVAVEEGATMVRVGEAIFGPRTLSETEE